MGAGIQEGDYMKLCQSHWDKLKQGITDAGLMRYVSNDGQQAVEKIDSQLKGDDSNDTYDPLMSANFAIWNNLLRIFGLEAMAPDAPECLLCYMDEAAKNGCGDTNCKEHHASGDDWVDYAVRDQVEQAKKRGLLSDAIN